VSVVSRVTVRVPAKVNLFLAVRGTRPDLMHEIVSVMQTVGLHDEVEASLTGPLSSCHHPAARRQMDVELHHDAGPDVPAGEQNLVLRAARALGARLGLGADRPGSTLTSERSPVTQLVLRKGIPIAAGMAGGSADAAAAIVALDQLWGAELSRAEQRSIASELGSDVPFCLLGGTALATGTGTATAQVLARGTYHWVVGVDEEPLSTPEVYRAWDEVGSADTTEPDAVLHALRTGDVEALGAALHNALEIAAFALRPGLRDRRDAMLGAGSLGAVVSGSGPTVVGLARDEADAHRIESSVRDRFDRTAVVRSPAGGPELVACE
jgi:4-diphosphocytidyl-2-C-methyl-D-erythritol kinase